jgi:hypothetical protein
MSAFALLNGIKNGVRVHLRFSASSPYAGRAGVARQEKRPCGWTKEIVLLESQHGS